jgi:hypothetical protein
VFICYYFVVESQKATNTPRRRFSCCPSHIYTTIIKHIGHQGCSPFSSSIIHATRRTIVTSIIIHIPFLVGSYSCCCPSNNCYIHHQTHWASKKKALSFRFIYPATCCCPSHILKALKHIAHQNRKPCPFSSDSDPRN